MQLAMTVFVLLGLSVLRYDAGRLVLGPLRRMLKIVAFCEFTEISNILTFPKQKLYEYLNNNSSTFSFAC